MGEWGEETILDWVILNFEHGKQTFHYAKNMFDALHVVMKNDLPDYWVDELKTICAVICYWIASNILETNKLTHCLINKVLGTNYCSCDLEDLKMFIVKKLEYDILIYL